MACGINGKKLKERNIFDIVSCWTHLMESYVPHIIALNYHFIANWNISNLYEQYLNNCT